MPGRTCRRCPLKVWGVTRARYLDAHHIMDRRLVTASHQSGCRRPPSIGFCLPGRWPDRLPVSRISFLCLCKVAVGTRGRVDSLVAACSGFFFLPKVAAGS